LADVTGDGKVQESEFLQVFKRFNKTGLNESVNEEYVDWKLEVMARFERVVKEHKKTLETAFNEIDKDGDGRVTIEEFDMLFKKINIRIERKEFEKFFYDIDTNKTGFIGYIEFLAYANRAKKESERA
jgi:Ca2+-binding EF-hand superfamily protein